MTPKPLYAAMLMAAAAFLPQLASAADMLTDDKGMTLYTFDQDMGGKSACYGDCAVNWPPYLVEEGEKMPADWTMVDRTDGTKQWAYDGKPVYFFVGDKAKGDATGDGKGGVWHVIKE